MLTQRLSILQSTLNLSAYFDSQSNFPLPENVYFDYNRVKITKQLLQ